MANLAVPKNVFALDLGTTKFCLATLRRTPNGGLIIDTVSVPAEGMRRGMIANKDEATRALSKLIDSAEGQFGCDVKKVVVGIAGTHLRHRFMSSEVAIQGQLIQPVDIHRLSVAVEESYQDVGREILHIIPLRYRIDSREPIEDPIGFTGHRLLGDYFIIDADKFYLRDVVSLCNLNGLEVDAMWSEPVASSTVTVPDRLKLLGAVVVDIGGGTSDGLIYQRGKPVEVFTLNVAGKLMTNDVAIGLNIPYDEAEKAKVYFGVKPVTQEFRLELRDLHDKPKIVAWEDIYPVLGPRVYELGCMIAKRVELYRGSLGGGLLLTGGGAEVAGIETFLQKIIKIPVRRLLPDFPEETIRLYADAIGQPSETRPAKYATAVGLLNLQLCRSADDSLLRRRSWTSRYFGQFINWIREMS